MNPSDLVKSLLENDTPSQGGLELRRLGFVPMDADERMGFEGAGPNSVVAHKGDTTYVYDFDDQVIEVISDEGISIMHRQATPIEVAEIFRKPVSALRQQYGLKSPFHFK